MNQRLCPRCHNVVPLTDDGSLVYCASCGMAQVKLSEDVRLAAAEQLAAEAAASLDPNSPLPRVGVERSTDPTAVVWAGAIQSVALAGLIATGLTLLAFGLNIFVALLWLWCFAAPIVVLGIYAVRFPRTHISARLGARMGVLCGLAVAFPVFALNTLALTIARFGFHQDAFINARMAAVFTQMKTSLPQYNPEDARVVLRWLGIAEFRVGLVLASVGITLALYIAYCFLAGSFAGLLRSSSRRRSTP